MSGGMPGGAYGYGGQGGSYAKPQNNWRPITGTPLTNNYGATPAPAWGGAYYPSRVANRMSINSVPAGGGDAGGAVASNSAITVAAPPAATNAVNPTAAAPAASQPASNAAFAGLPANVQAAILGSLNNAGQSDWLSPTGSSQASNLWNQTYQNVTGNAWNGNSTTSPGYDKFASWLNQGAGNNYSNEGATTYNPLTGLYSGQGQSGYFDPRQAGYTQDRLNSLLNANIQGTGMSAQQYADAIRRQNPAGMGWYGS